MEVNTVARLLSCSSSTVHRMIEDGELSAFRLRKSGSWRIWRRSLEKVISRDWASE